MIPNVHNLDRVSRQDLFGLVESRVSEDLRLEFKSDAYGGAKGIREWCKDISALANTSGGVIILGVSERSGVAESIDGLDQDPDVVANRLEQAVQANIRPRILLKRAFVEIDPGRFVCLLGTPRSRTGPHMTMADGDKRFYKRANTDTVAMDVDELRNAYLLSEEESDIVQQDHLRAIQPIAEDVPGYRIYFDVVVPPGRGEFFDPAMQEQYEYAQKGLGPFSATGWNRRVTADGVKVFDASGDPSEAELLRSGTVRYRHVQPDQQGRLPVIPDGRWIPGGWFVPRLFESCTRAMRMQNHVGVPLPVYACLSLERCAGAPIALPHNRWSSPIEQDVLRFAPLAIDDWDVDIPSHFQPWLDYLWNAAGERRCDFYDENGRFIPGALNF